MSADLSSLSLIDLFRSEAEEYLALLSGGLQGLAEGGPDPDRLASWTRAAHSLKGASRIVNLHPAVRVSDSLERCFLAAEEREVNLGPGERDPLLRAVDLLAELIHLEEGQAIAWELAHENRLEEVVAGVLGIGRGPGHVVPGSPGETG